MSPPPNDVPDITVDGFFHQIHMDCVHIFGHWSVGKWVSSHPITKLEDKMKIINNFDIFE